MSSTPAYKQVTFIINGNKGRGSEYWQITPSHEKHQHTRSVALALTQHGNWASKPTLSCQGWPYCSFHTVKLSPGMESMWQLNAELVAQWESKARTMETEPKRVSWPSEGVMTKATSSKKKPQPEEQNARYMWFDQSPPNKEPLNKDTSELNNLLQHHD